jgi:flagellar basal-body rod protein FlgF
MNYGLYLSASGVLTNTYRQDVFANNLANVETPGFKPDIPSIRQRDPEAIEDNLGFQGANELLDRLGGGVLAGRQRINFTQAALRPTGNPLDVALQNKNQFFAIQALDSDTGQAMVRLTRDGRFTMNSERELVTQSGKRVLDNSDNPIVLDGPGVATIAQTGQVLLNGEPVAQLQVANVNNLESLNKIGQGLFAFEGADPRQEVLSPNIKAGYIEASGVDPIAAMMQVVGATKAATGNANMIKYHDQILDRAVNTLGRVG